MYSLLIVDHAFSRMVDTALTACFGLHFLRIETISGQQTAGKALPSGIRELPNGDRLQYVLFDLKTPSGSRYEGDGVIPDHPVVRTRADYVQGIDPEMTAAVNWITDQSTSDHSEDLGESK